MKAADLGKNFDLEYSNLLGVQWRKEIKEIELKFRCVVHGWWLKEKRNNVLGSVGLSALIERPGVEYLVEIVFLGVTSVTENLSEASPSRVGPAAADTTWIESTILEIDNVSVVKLENAAFRFYLRAESVQLDFNFVECIYRELCIRE